MTETKELLFVVKITMTYEIDDDDMKDSPEEYTDEIIETHFKNFEEQIQTEVQEIDTCSNDNYELTASFEVMHRVKIKELV